MTKLAITALATAALLAGCGGGKSSSAGTSATTAPPAATPTTTAATTASTPTTSAPASPANEQQAAAACSTAIKQTPTLTGTLKAKAEAICADVGAGNLTAARNAAEEVCKQVIKTSTLPTSAKEQAEAACKAELSHIAQ